MPPGTLACVAYVAARFVCGPCDSQVYDHGRSLLVRVGGTVRGSQVGLYDYDRSCNFYGTLPDLWDEHEQVGIQLSFDGPRFEAIGAGRRYSGIVDGSDVTLQDGDGRSHRYSIDPLPAPSGAPAAP